MRESEALNQFNETRHRSVRKECPEGAQHIRMQEKSIREKKVARRMITEDRTALSKQITLEMDTLRN